MRRHGGVTSAEGGRTGAVVACLSLLLLVPAEARAQAISPVDLWLGPCDGVDTDALRRLVALELGPAPASAEGARARATVTCADGQASITVQAPHGAPRRRLVELDSQPVEARARLVALVLAEAVDGGGGGTDHERRGSPFERRAPASRSGGTGRPSEPRRVAASPASPDLAGLRILEREAGRYGDRSSGYLATVVTMARRDFERRRRVVAEGYDLRLGEEADRLDAARRRAIADYAAFIARHPEDPVATAGARLRLAELTHELAHEAPTER